MYSYSESGCVILRPRLALNVLLTCRHIYAENALLPCSNLTFDVNCYAEDLNRILSTMLPVQQAGIVALELRINNLTGVSLVYLTGLRTVRLRARFTWGLDWSRFHSAREYVKHATGRTDVDVEFYDTSVETMRRRVW